MFCVDFHVKSMPTHFVMRFKSVEKMLYYRVVVFYVMIGAGDPTGCQEREPSAV